MSLDQQMTKAHLHFPGTAPPVNKKVGLCQNRNLDKFENQFTQI